MSYSESINVVCVDLILECVNIVFMYNVILDHHCLVIRDVYTSCCINGLAIVSMLSAGHINTTAVPLQTTSPRFLVSSVILNGSSGAAVPNNALYQTIGKQLQQKIHHTLHVLNGSIQDQIQKLIISFQNTGCYSYNIGGGGKQSIYRIARKFWWFGGLPLQPPNSYSHIPSLPPWNFTRTFFSTYLPSSALNKVSFRCFFSGGGTCKMDTTQL